MPHNEPSPSRLQSRNVVAADRRTSMRLEPELWNALRDIARREGCYVSEVIERAWDAEPVGGRTSAVRIFLLGYYRRLAETLEGGST